ncbi:MAG TPA: Rieske 2Fe-2S domain-containing protein [Pirellulales bacterium]|nr:Rieske 2Fe-2S domain-containing protein [Pirellulales bacterium]
MDDIPLAPVSPKPKAPSSSQVIGKAISGATAPGGEPRRGFVAKFLAVVIGAVATLLPVASGVAVLLDPLRRKSGAGTARRITTLDSLPDDGVPRQFPVLADRQDAWNRFPNEQIGAVYLRRLPGSDKVEAFNAYCPHAGCFVAFKPERNQYQCPCHTSAFEVDGQRVMPCVSPRDLDSLACEVRTDGADREIYVDFMNFYSGIAEKKPKA